MKQFRISLILGFILALIPLNDAKGQYMIPCEAPKISELKALSSFRSAKHELEFVLPELNKDSFRAVSSSKEESELRVYRFAVNRPLALDLNNLGQWYQDDKGQKVWRFSITSPKALSSSVLLEDFQLEADAKLFVYGANRQPNLALTSINNNDTHSIQLAPIQGERLNFLYIAPRKARDSRITLPFRITRFSHGFRSFKAKDPKELYGCDEGEPFFDLFRNSLEELSCADNVIKHEAQDLEARSVLLMITDGSMMSSAALVNNKRSDGTAYVLTASHCVNQLFKNRDDLDKVKQSVAQAVFFFGFQSPAPNLNIRGSEEKTICGAELIAYNASADMALLKLTGLPTDANGQKVIPPSYNPYFSGWNISSQPKGPFFNIHHPKATTKRFNETEASEIYLMNNPYEVQGNRFVRKHWVVERWAIGTTAAGSSGSPLFDYNGKIIGALTGGVSTCSAPRDDKYYAIYKTWNLADENKSLKPWLDPDDSKETICEGFDPNAGNKVYRLSECYGLDIPFEACETKSHAVGRKLTIESEGQYKALGLYLVFKGNKALQKEFPEHLLKVYQFQDNKVEHALLSLNLDMPMYRYFDSEKNDFSTNSRTILADTVEIFLPITDDVELNKGEYLLSLERKEAGKEMLVPVLQTDQSTKGSRISYFLEDGAWRQQTNKALWIDLVLQSKTQIITANEEVLAFNKPKLYYYRGQVYISSLQARKTLSNEQSLDVYDLSGQLVFHKKLRGQSQISLEHLAKNQVYLARIQDGSKLICTKFLHK